MSNFTKKQIKDIKLTDEIIDPSEMVQALDSLDSRLDDMELTTLGMTPEEIVRMLGKIIQKFGGKVTIDDTQIQIEITQEDIDNGTNTVSLLCSPFVADPSKAVTIDWGDGSPVETIEA